jgi:hypothetical protein
MANEYAPCGTLIGAVDWPMVTAEGSLGCKPRPRCDHDRKLTESGNEVTWLKPIHRLPGCAYGCRRDDQRRSRSDECGCSNRYQRARCVGRGCLPGWWVPSRFSTFGRPTASTVRAASLRLASARAEGDRRLVGPSPLRLGTSTRGTRRRKRSVARTPVRCRSGCHLAALPALSREEQLRCRPFRMGRAGIEPATLGLKADPAGLA